MLREATTFEVRNDRREAANALQLIFAIRRGRLGLRYADPPLAIASNRLPEGLWETEENRVVRLVWRDRWLEPNEKTELDLLAPGEPLRLVFFEWGQIPGRPDISDSRRHFTASRTPYNAISCWREEQAQLDGWVREKQFFNFFDRETLEEASPLWASMVGITNSQRVDAINGLLAYLIAGSRERRQRQSDDDFYAQTPPPSLTSETPPNALGVISRIFVKGFEDHFTKPGAPVAGRLVDRLDLEAIKDAFDLFSTGQLNLLPGARTRCADVDPASKPWQIKEFQAPACQPDSGYLILFAEFAHACVLRGVEVELWRALLPALVHSIWNFLYAYAPTTSSPMLSDFRPKEKPSTSVPELAALKVDRKRFETQATGQQLFKIWKDYLVNWLDPNA